MKQILAAAIIALTTTPLLFGQTGTLKVEGEAILYAVPEMINVQVPIQAKDAAYEKTAASLTNTYNDLSFALEKAGLRKEDIRSSGLTISEKYVYSDRERKKDGYTGHINAEIKMPHTDKMINAFMKTMSDERFNFGYQLAFELSEAQKESLRKRALKAATEDAGTKATDLAENLGVRLISISEVTYGGESREYNPLVMRADANTKSEMQEVSLNPREIEIRQKVMVVWIISN